MKNTLRLLRTTMSSLPDLPPPMGALPLHALAVSSNNLVGQFRR
jgi:hypothetical protein